MSAPAAVICGVGGWVPPRVVTNHDLAAVLDTDDTWIRDRTGIRSRHVIDRGMSTGDLAVEAGASALKSAGAADVDAVVLATTTPDRPCPGTAPSVATRLGLGPVAAHDVSAVCTGFLYGLADAAGLIATGSAESVLLIGAEAFSTLLDPTDRTTAAIFADGAGAVVLRAGERDEPGAVGPVVLASDGAGTDLITVPAGGAQQRSTGPAGPFDHYFQMEGRAVYRRAIASMVEVSQQALDRAGWTLDGVDRFVAHQANARICSAVADRLGIPSGNVLTNIDHVGNTAAASIPLLLAEAAHVGALRAGHRVLLTAFGGGLTWGGATLEWPDLPPVADVGTSASAA